MVSVKVESLDGNSTIRCTSRLKVTIQYQSEMSLSYPVFLVGIYASTKTGLFLLDSDAVGGLPEVLPAEGSVTCVTESINLTPGRCYVNIAVFKAGEQVDYVEYATSFDVEAEDIYGTGKIPPRDWVTNVLKHKWSFNGS
jgi:lipopolysaccharide transport system ATP-binding protein